MKKFLHTVAFAAALASAGAANALTFETVSGSPFTNQFVLTPTSSNSAAFSVSGLMAQFSSVNFSILGGPTVAATSVGNSLTAAFSDPRNASFELTGGTPYTVTISGVTRTQLPGVFGLVSINTLNGTVAAVPEPETYAMLLAGLGLIVFAARRRSANKGSAVSFGPLAG